MPALIDLRRRIRSVHNTQQITQAMKTVSTAKFRKAQRTVFESRPYWHTLPDLMARVVDWAGACGHPLASERNEKKVTGLVFSSDKGLCGAFNSNLMAKALSFFEEKSRTSEVRLVLIGKKAVNFFKRHNFRVDRAYGDKVDKITVEELRELAQFLMRQYAFTRTDAVYVIYNEFKSILTPRITVARVLPVSAPQKEEGRHPVFPDWEPGQKFLLESLLPLYVENQIFHAFFESSAAEHAARMMSMDNASKNADELISDLVLVLNKIRQASITRELLEIMTAVEALSK